MQLGSYESYLTMILPGIKYCQALIVGESNFAVCTNSRFIKLVTACPPQGTTEPEFFPKFQQDGNFRTSKRQRTKVIHTSN